MKTFSLFFLCALCAQLFTFSAQGSETLTSGVSSILRDVFEEDDGATWSCRVCRYSNWKQHPPYVCGNCGTQMGAGS